MKTNPASIVALAIGIGLLAPFLQAQQSPPKPSPEIQKMGIFAGKWHLEEDDEATPFGPGGKSTMETEVRFIHDGFMLEEAGQGKNPDGTPYSYTILYYYDPAGKTLRSLYYDNGGAADQTVGKLEGNAWKNQWNRTFKGKDYKCKGISTVSPDGKKFTYEWSYTEDGETWKRMFTGTATKVGDSQKKPSAEIKKLGVLAGKWKLEEVVEASPFGPAAKGTFDTETRFTFDGFFLEERGHKTGGSDAAPFSYATIYYYDATAHVYRTLFQDSDGTATRGEATFDGTTWKNYWTQEAGGKAYRCKDTTVVAADGKSWTYEWSYSQDGETWRRMLKGTATKVADAPTAPGPEHKKLEAFTGKWEWEGANTASPLGPAGNAHGTTEARMVLGGFFLETSVHGVGPEGEFNSLEILAYDAEKSRYEDAWFDSSGAFNPVWKGESISCTAQGDTWTWSWNEEKAGKKYSCRAVDVFAPDRKSYTTEASYSEDGTTWKKRGQGKSVKVRDVMGGQRPSAKEAIAAANKRFEEAFLRGDAEAIGNQYTETAKMFVDRQPVCVGRQAIAASYKAFSAEANAAKASCQSTEVVQAGDWAHESGTFVLAGKDGNVIVNNNYLCIWTIENGQWKIQRDIATANPLAQDQNAEKGIEQWHRKYGELLRKGDVAAIGAMHTKDAELYSPGQSPIRGRDAIERDAREYASKVSSGETLDELTDIEVEQNGDTAYNICGSVQKTRDGKILDEGIYVGFWKREGGEWKLHRDFYTPAPRKKQP